MTAEVTQLLTVLAATLGTTVEYLWGVLLFQAVLGGIINLTLLLIWVIAAVILTRCLIAQKRKCDDSEIKGMIDMIIIFGCLLLALIGTIAVEAGITRIINPGFWALQQVLEVSR